MTRENTANSRERDTDTKPLAPELSLGGMPRASGASTRVDSMIGRRIGSYEILSRVARGGMGVVYRARHVYIDKIVAIKVLDPQLAQRQDLIERFRTEAQSLARVEHENVVKVIDITEDGGMHGIVMDFAEGRNLRVRVKELGPLQPEELLSVARQTAEALLAAHREGILHRDIKPENLIVNSRGRCRLADFGLAGDLRLIAEGHEGPINFGTPAYSSPEVLRRISPDKRSDVFSYGAALYHLATGEPPFGQSGHAQIMLRQKQGAAPLASLRPDLPAKLCRLIDECLALHPRHRPQTFAEVLERLPRRAHNRPAGAHTETTDLLATSTAPLPRPARIWPWVVAGALVLAAAVAAATWALWPAPREPQTPPEAGGRAGPPDARPPRVDAGPKEAPPSVTLPIEQAFNSAELDARTALSRADYAAAWASYETFLQQFPKSDFTDAARAKRREVQSRVTELRAQAWRKAQESAEAALKDSRTVDALAALDRFPAELLLPLWPVEDVEIERRIQTQRQVVIAAEETDLAALFKQADGLRRAWQEEAQRPAAPEHRRLAAAPNLLRERDLLERFLSGRTAGVQEKVNHRLAELRKQLEAAHQASLPATQAWRQYCAGSRPQWAARAAEVHARIAPLMAERDFEAARARLDEAAQAITQSRSAALAGLPSEVAERVRARPEVENLLRALREDLVLAEKCGLALQGALRRNRLGGAVVKFSMHHGYEPDGRRSARIDGYSGKVVTVNPKDVEIQGETGRFTLKFDLMTIECVRDLVRPSQNAEEQASLVAWLVAVGRAEAAGIEEARIARMAGIPTETLQRMREMAAAGRLAPAAQRRLEFMAGRKDAQTFEKEWGPAALESRLLRAREAAAAGQTASYLALVRDVADAELVHADTMSTALAGEHTRASDARLRVALEPWDAEAHAALAAALARENAGEVARQEARRALLLDPSHEGAHALLKQLEP